MTAGVTISDLSAYPRLGFKGRGTIEAAKKLGFALEDTPNRAFVQSEGQICMVLSHSEVFLLDTNPAGDRLSRLEQSWRFEDRTFSYPLPRQHSHAWYRLQGADASNMLAKVCGVDLRPQVFANLSIAQTSVARLSALVLRADIDGEVTYHILADNSASKYMLECLQDASNEFNQSRQPS